MILKMHEITYKTRLGILTALMWTRCWRPSSSCGWPTLACRPASPTTGRPSSPLARGETGFRSRGYSTSPPQPITHRPMVWWSGFTTLWRQPCVPKGGPLPGRFYHHSWLALVRRRTILDPKGLMDSYSNNFWNPSFIFQAIINTLSSFVLKLIMLWKMSHTFSSSSRESPGLRLWRKLTIDIII